MALKYKLGTPLFLSDLREDMKESEERLIRKGKRKDLIKSLDKGEEIQIGIYYGCEDREYQAF